MGMRKAGKTKPAAMITHTPGGRVTDEAFIGAWRRTGSSTMVAKEFGLSVRAVLTRRRNLEARYGIALLGKSSDASDHGPTRVHREVLGGSVAVFSDCHYWPGLVSLAHQALCRVVADVLRPTLKLRIANGDVLDGATCSRHDPLHWQDLPTVMDELKAVQDRLAEIDRAAPGVENLKTAGNHDTRFDRFLAMNVPEFAGVKGLRLQDHLPDWPISYSVMINDGVPGGMTMVKHAYKGGIHAPRNNALNAGISIVTGHLHSQKQAPVTDYTGTRYGVDAGMIASPFAPSFAYTLDNPCDWRSGFAVLTYDERGRLLPPEFCEVQHWRHKGDVFGRAVFRGRVVLDGREHESSWYSKRKEGA